jgi:hypothetical protein
MPVTRRDGGKTGAQFHDGFYLRLGVGIGWHIGELTAEDVDGEITTTGIAIPVEVALGGTPVPGIVLGVGAYGLHLPSIEHELTVGDVSVSDTADWGTLTAIGPFLDFYMRPAFGVHVQIAPTLVLAAPGNADTSPSDLRGVGFGAMLGAGYEVWVADQWGAGWLLRVQGAKVTLESENGDEFDYLAITPSVLFTVTLH